MVNREEKYGQIPNRIVDVDTFLSLNQSFKDLERLISSFGRTLSDNERRLQQTLPGMIKTFDRIEKEYNASGTGKINASQAADLKVMLANKELILKWLDQLSKFDPKTGLSLNDRNDTSYIQYAKIFEDVMQKLTSSMQRAYKEWDGYSNTIAEARKRAGLLVTPPPTAQNTSVPAIKSDVYDPLATPLMKAIEGAYKKGLIPENEIRAVRLRANVAQSIPSPEKYDVLKNPSIFTAIANAWKQKRQDDINKQIQSQLPYMGQGPVHISKSQRLIGIAHTNAVDTKFFGEIQKVLGSLPIVGKISSIATSLSKGAGSANNVGEALVSKFGKFTKIGKVGTLLAGPIGAAIGATAIAVGMIYKQMKKSSPVLQAVTDIMELAWNLLWMPLGNALGAVLLPMAEWMINFAIAFNRLFSDFSWENLTEFFYASMQMMWGPLTQLVGALPRMLINHWLESASNFFRAVGLDGVADVLDDFKDLYNKVTDWIMNFPTHMGTFVTDLITKLKAALKDIFNLGDSAKNISEAYEQAKSGNWAGAAKSALKATPGGKALSMLGVPLASGGVVTSPSFHLIGESGPEAVIPLDKAGGIGTTYVININGDVYGVNDLESRIERVIQRTANKSYYR